MFHQIEKLSVQSEIRKPYRLGIKPRDYFALIGAEANGGVIQAIEDIQDWQELGYITKSEARTIKRNLKDFQSRYNRLSAFTENKRNELLSKFEQKVAENRCFL
jgi:hypothetical protein